MKTALAGIALVPATFALPARSFLTIKTLAACALGLGLATGVRAQDSRIEFILSNTQLSLHSLDGADLPLNASHQRQFLSARAYGNAGEDRQERRLEGEPAGALHAAFGTAYADLRVDGFWGDMRALAAFTGPSADWATSEFAWGSFGSFVLPARSTLTLTGSAEVRSAGAPDTNAVRFESALIADTAGAFGERYELRGADASSQFFLTAINPLDQPAGFDFYMELSGLAQSVSPVPEAPGWAMLGAGLALLPAALRRKRCRHTARLAS